MHMTNCLQYNDDSLVLFSVADIYICLGVKINVPQMLYIVSLIIDSAMKTCLSKAAEQLSDMLKQCS